MHVHVPCGISTPLPHLKNHAIRPAFKAIDLLEQLKIINLILKSNCYNNSNIATVKILVVFF